MPKTKKVKEVTTHYIVSSDESTCEWPQTSSEWYELFSE